MTSFMSFTAHKEGQILNRHWKSEHPKCIMIITIVIVIIITIIIIIITTIVIVGYTFRHR